MIRVNRVFRKHRRNPGTIDLIQPLFFQFEFYAGRVSTQIIKNICSRARIEPARRHPQIFSTSIFHWIFDQGLKNDRPTWSLGWNMDAFRVKLWESLGRHGDQEGPSREGYAFNSLFPPPSHLTRATAVPLFFASYYTKNTTLPSCTGARTTWIFNSFPFVHQDNTSSLCRECRGNLF